VYNVDYIFRFKKQGIAEFRPFQAAKEERKKRNVPTKIRKCYAVSKIRDTPVGSLFIQPQ
jgi:hypothetical protein